MAEKERKPKWDWQGMELDMPVHMELLGKPFHSSSKDKKTGEDKPWHLYNIRADNPPGEFAMFPYDNINSALATAGVTAGGDRFTITQKAAKNPKTRKTFTCYEVTYGNTTVNSKDYVKGADPQPEAATPKPQKSAPASKPNGPAPTHWEPSPKVMARGKQLDQLRKRIWDFTYDWITAKAIDGSLTGEKVLEIRQGVVQHTAAMIDTQIMQRDPGMILYEDQIPMQPPPAKASKSPPETTPEQAGLAGSERLEFIEKLKEDTMVHVAGSIEDGRAYIRKALGRTGPIPSWEELSSSELRKIRATLEKDMKP